MFGSVKIGVFLFGCHIVSALICGLIFVTSAATVTPAATALLLL